MTTYPPERHLLRDLRMSFDNTGGESRAWLPVVPEVCGDDGAVRAGALTTLVDVIGGGLAASTASPDWIATADLTLHMTAPVTAGTVEARAEVLRAGRSTVVLEVGLYADAGNSVGTATMSFSVLPRRESNPDIGASRPAGSSTMAVDGSSLDAPLFDLVGIETVDATRGVVEVPVRTWATNSMGALQGGVVGLVVEAAGEAALRHATNEPLVVTDIQLTYLAFGRAGPLRTETDVLMTAPGHGVARVQLFDTGAETRQMSLARVTATRSLT